MRKNPALVIFWFGVFVMALGGILFASLILNLFGYEIEALWGSEVYLGSREKLLLGVVFFLLGAVIARLTGKSAGKYEEGTTFIERFKKSMKL